jgi:hypothetical protein
MKLLESLGLAKRATEAPQGLTINGRVLEPGEYSSLQLQVEQLTESLVSLRKEDVGWENLSAQYSRDISREGLTQNADLVRLMSTMNPLMKRGKLLRAGYVFGQGLEIAAREEDDGQDVDEVVQAYITEEGNKGAIFGPQARADIENDLFDDGNVFVAHFVDPLDGKVTARTIPFDEIAEIVTDPNDRSTPWFYKRVWTESVLRQGYNPITAQRTAYYPALKYQPLTKMARIGEHPVMWPGTVGGAAVYHIKVNGVGRSRIWGIGDGFAAVPWARAYKEFLEDWALLMKALSRIAWIVKGKNDAKSTDMRKAAQAASQAGAGGIAYTGNTELEAPSKSGATLDSESGRPIAAMTAAALGVPVTMLLSDPGQTGARAVAETLDMPMRLEIQGRQELHAEFYKASIGFALEQAVLAPRGPLRGKVVRKGDRLTVTMPDGQPPTVDVTFPDLEELDTKVLMESVEIADGLNLLPPLEKLKLVAAALKIKDVADLIDQVTDDDGNFVAPEQTTADAAGAAAATKLRQGEDPADVL